MTHLFVSDLHLDGSAPAATDQFLKFLAHEAPRATSLHVLGDLFESWVGDDDLDDDHARVVSGLRDLTARGVPCFVLHGNRDFLLGPRFEQATGCRLLPDPVVAHLAGRRVLLTHGDLLCTSDVRYQELRSIVRDPAWQRRVLALPLADRLRLAGEARAGSRAHTQRVAPVIMDAHPGAITAAFRAADVDWLIHGHTHRPAIHALEVDARPRTRVVLGAWYETGSVAVLDAHGIDLRSLPRSVTPPGQARPSGSGTPHRVS